jgi:alkylated DNA repair dioxygenase AlkB
MEHRALGDGAWVDLRRAWVTGADALFSRLVTGVSWRADRRAMYDRVVDVPRLVSFVEGDGPLPDPALADARALLDDHYASVSNGGFRSTGLCLYRNGGDSVAWHGDTLGRGAFRDTVVAIVSLGATRRLLLRPVGGGASVRFDLSGGDLLVMGGSCQRTWQHSVPKTARPVGPRLSVQFRPHGVR